MQHKKYLSIERLKNNYTDGFQKGDLIIIQEKIDGANASFQYDFENNQITAYSRKQTLSLENNLRGFWEYAQSLDKEKYNDLILKDLRFFGEWLVQHTVKYPSDCYQKFYLFDIYNTATQKYLTQDIVKTLAEKLGLIYVPTLYIGEFQSWEHIYSFLGQTKLGGEYGEGIVVKNMSKINNPNTRLPFYIKIVCSQFTETKGVKEQKVINLEEQADKEYKLELVKSIVTKERITKTLHKMVDENIIPVDWNESNMGVIAKNINSLIYHDCVKEEKEIVEEVGDTFGKLCGSTCMRIVKEILLEKK